jgi:F0F1-type ATP synthase assembly protein I
VPLSAGTLFYMARRKTIGTTGSGDDVEARIGWRMAGIGMETASYVLGGVFLGWLAKESFGGGDGWIVGGAIAGIASGISQMIRSGLKLNRQLDRATGKKGKIRPDGQPRESGSESESKAG